jgi:glycosyltransferase involved in cell wall biosynthesis
MTQAKTGVVMVGAFPPPVHGMALVNAAVRDQIAAAGSPPDVIDIAARSLDRSMGSRLGRLPRVIRGLVRLCLLPDLKKRSLYMSVSGGFGQLYELAFVLLARLRGSRIFLHHHSAAYLTRRKTTTQLLVRAAGPQAVHILQSEGLAASLRQLYSARMVVEVSNAIFYDQEIDYRLSPPRQKLKTLGFLSNISAEKGVLEFIDLMTAIEQRGLALEGRMAGPFEDEDIERQVIERVSALPNLHYEGPLYGSEKAAFYSRLDAFVFPTQYANEAEPMVLHEAMRNALPVIAYGRGAIPEIVPDSAGLVIDPGVAFVPGALEQVVGWHSDPVSFNRYSHSARETFASKRDESKARWSDLYTEILRGGVR